MCPYHNHHATFQYPIFLGFLSIWKFPVLPEFYHRENSNIKKLFLRNIYMRGSAYQKNVTYLMYSFVNSISQCLNISGGNTHAADYFVK